MTKRRSLETRERLCDATTWCCDILFGSQKLDRKRGAPLGFVTCGTSTDFSLVLTWNSIEAASTAVTRLSYLLPSVVELQPTRTLFIERRRFNKLWERNIRCTNRTRTYCCKRSDHHQATTTSELRAVDRKTPVAIRTALTNQASTTAGRHTSPDCGSGALARSFDRLDHKASDIISRHQYANSTFIASI